MCHESLGQNISFWLLPLSTNLALKNEHHSSKSIPGIATYANPLPCPRSRPSFAFLLPLSWAPWQESSSASSLLVT